MESRILFSRFKSRESTDYCRFQPRSTHVAGFWPQKYLESSLATNGTTKLGLSRTVLNSPDLRPKRAKRAGWDSNPRFAAPQAAVLVLARLPALKRKGEKNCL